VIQRSRCVLVRSRRTTEYASDASGHPPYRKVGLACG
jgi:hypothetical protein